MKQPRYSAMVSLVVLLLAGSNGYAAQAAASDTSEKEKACLAIRDGVIEDPLQLEAGP